MEGHDQGIWCVTEKIHGANFSFHLSLDDTMGFHIKCAKRSGFLKDDEKFHGWKDLRDSLYEQLYDLYHKVALKSSDIVIVYGEICGGAYPHINIPKCQVSSRVQKGVFYHPKVQFLAFDIMLNGEFIPYKAAEFHLSNAKLPYCHSMYLGTFKECLAHSNVFQSIIPEYFQLPEIEGNICEGVVIKPYESVFYLLDGTRVIVKSKNEKFKEISGENGRGKPKVPKESLPENIQKLIMEVSRYCTPQRLDNVISKIGEVTMKDFGLIMKQMNLDVFEEFEKDFLKELTDLNKSDINKVRKSMGQFNAPLIKKWMMENI
jgi:Rnl2 family RNA ligase